MLRRAYQLTCSACGGYHLPNLSDDPRIIDTTPLYAELLSLIHKTDGKIPATSLLDANTPQGKITKANNDTLLAATIEGFTGKKNKGKNTEAYIAKGIKSIQYNTPDAEKLNNLRSNVYTFSYAKNYHQLRDLTDALMDGDRIRPFEEFRKKAVNILDEYQGNWLKAEYNLALQGATMASKWVGFQKIADRKKGKVLLEYRTVGDARVREEHRALNGVRKPMDDPFWKTWYPPNGYNCRCTVIAVNSGDETPDADITYPEKVPGIFKTNIAELGLAFPLNHPYFTDLPDDVRDAQLRKLPYTEQAFTIYKPKKGKGIVKQHLDYTPAQDAADLTLAATYMADKLNLSVTIMPQLEAEDKRRALLVPPPRGRRNPDFLINGVWADLKHIGKNGDVVELKAVHDRIKQAKKQADSAVILINDGLFTEEDLKNQAYRELKSNRFKQVIFLLLSKTGQISKHLAY